MIAIMKRELSAYFTSATAYVVLALFLFSSGLLFNISTFGSNSTSFYVAFMWMFFVVVFIVPIITMKSFADEKRRKTDQALLTSPVSLVEIVTGKFLGAFLLYAIVTVIFLIYGVVVSFFAKLEWSVLLCSVLGFLLLGAALIAVNVFISSLTESTVVAAVAGMGFALAVILIYFFVNNVSVEWIAAVLQKINLMGYYENFIYGILSVSDVVFFLSLTALFLFFTGRSLDRRRWS